MSAEAVANRPLLPNVPADAISGPAVGRGGALKHLIALAPRSCRADSSADSCERLSRQATANLSSCVFVISPKVVMRSVTACVYLAACWWGMAEASRDP